MRRSGFNTAAQSVLWLVWGGLPLILCGGGPWLTPGKSDKMEIFWIGVVIWAFLTAGVLFHVLFGARIQLHGVEDGLAEDLRLEYVNRRIITLGLIGGFSIAMPALAFTIIAFVAMVPHFNRGFSEESTLVLPDGAQLQASAESKSSYIVAVDVSGSSIPSSANQQKPPVEQVCEAVQVLLAKEAGVRIVRPQDAFRALVFAGERNPIISQEDPYDKAAIRSTFCDTLKRRLRHNYEQREHSNFEFFLEYLEAWASADAASHQSVTILFFSDFMHEPGPENTEEIEKSVERFMTRMRTFGNRVRVVGFPMRGNGWKRPSNAIDILPSLERYSIGWESQARIWQEIPMDQFVGVDPKHWREIFLLSSYREVTHPEPLHLRYQIAPSWKPIPATVTVPEDGDHGILYLGIRPSRRDAGPVTVRFEDGKGSSPFKLTFGDNGQPALNRYERRGGSFKLALEDEVEVSQSAECDLKIVVPDLRVVHSIKLVMHPVFGDLAESAVQYTLYFLSVAVALLAFRASGIPEASARWKWRNGKGA